MHTLLLRATLVVALVGLVGATGCFTQRVVTEISPDGSGTNVFEFGVSTGLLEMMGDGDDPLDFEGLDSQVEALPESWNARHERFDSDGMRGIRITTNFADLAEMTEQLNTLVTRLAGEEVADEAPEAEPLLRDVTVSGYEDGTLHLRGTANATLPAGEMDAETTEMLRAMFGEPNLGWTVTMPGLRSYRPEDLGESEDNTVHFPFELGESHDLVVTGQLDPAAVADHLAEDQAFDPARLQEYLEGTWRFDIEALREAMRSQGLAEDAIERRVRDLAELRLHIEGSRFQLMRGEEDGAEELIEFRIIVQTDRSLTLQNAAGDRVVITFMEQRRITMLDENVPAPMTLIRD